MTRKSTLMVGRGRVQRIDDGGPVQRHQVEGLAGELLDGVERATDYGFASHPQPGAEGVLLSIAGVRGQSVIVAVGDRRYRFALAEGEVALFDDLGQSVHLSRDGIRVVSPIKVEIEAPVVAVTATTDIVLSAPNITLDGQVALGGTDAGLKPIARHDDAVVAGKVVATATKAFAK